MLWQTIAAVSFIFALDEGMSVKFNQSLYIIQVQSCPRQHKTTYLQHIYQTTQRLFDSKQQMIRAHGSRDDQ